MANTVPINKATYSSPPILSLPRHCSSVDCTQDAWQDDAAVNLRTSGWTVLQLSPRDAAVLRAPLEPVRQLLNAVAAAKAAPTSEETNSLQPEPTEKRWRLPSTAAPNDPDLATVVVAQHTTPARCQLRHNFTTLQDAADNGQDAVDDTTTANSLFAFLSSALPAKGSPTTAPAPAPATTPMNHVANCTDSTAAGADAIHATLGNAHAVLQGVAWSVLEACQLFGSQELKPCQ